MSEDNTGAAESQADDATQPQAGATQTAQAASAEPVDVATLQRELAEARREAARYRTQERQREAAEREALPLQERLQRERADLERERAEFQRERRELRLREVVGRSAAAMGFVDPEDAFLMLDRSAIEFGDDGNPRGVDRMLRELVQRKPHLLSPNRTATVTRGVQQSGTDAGDWNAAFRRAAGVTPNS